LTNALIQAGDDSQPFLKLSDCINAHVQHCQFGHDVAIRTNGAAIPNHYFVDVVGPAGPYAGMIIDHCKFVRGYSGTPVPTSIEPKAIHVGVGGRSVRISGPSVESPVAFIGDAITLDYVPSPEAFVEAVLIGGSGMAGGAFVSLPITDPNGNRTLWLGLNQRVRLPRLSEAGKTAVSPSIAAGDVIYNTDSNQVELCVSTSPITWVGLIH
jgi:hypothetical protein